MQIEKIEIPHKKDFCANKKKSNNTSVPLKFWDG